MISEIKPSSPQFVAAVIHYRDPEAVLRLVGETETWRARPTELVVVDNSGELSEPQWHDQLSPHVTVLDMGGNRGYAGAANAALRHASTAGWPDAFLLLTQDCHLEDDAAYVLLAGLQKPGVSLALPILGFASDPTRVFSAGGTLAKDGSTRHIGYGTPMDSVSRSEASYDVHWGDGACLMMRCSEVLGLGGFDESYFLYVEEIDLQLRLRRNGGRVLMMPAARAYQEPGDCSPYYKYRNRSYFTHKFSDEFRQFPWYRAIWRDSLRSLLKFGKPEGLLWALSGLRDYRSNRMGGPRPASAISSLLPRRNR